MQLEKRFVLGVLGVFVVALPMTAVAQDDEPYSGSPPCVSVEWVDSEYDDYDETWEYYVQFVNNCDVRVDIEWTDNSLLKRDRDGSFGYGIFGLRLFSGERSRRLLLRYEKRWGDLNRRPVILWCGESSLTDVDCPSAHYEN